jgi:ABC-2 type transport system ATP-binding protein
MQNNDVVLSVNNLTKYYGKFKALDNVSFELKKGQIVGLLGKNGAGKSTLLRSILGFLKYQGNVKLFGKEIKDYKEKIFNYIGFIPDVNSLDDRLTVEQTINYVKNLNDTWDDEKAKKLLAISELPYKKKIKKISKGMKTKLYLLLILSLKVQLLLLDEPTLGLDIAFRKEFFNTILGDFYDENKTIMISTHQVEEVEHILSDIIFIDRGKIILFDEIENLKERYSIVQLPKSEIDTIQKHNPLLINKSIANIEALVEGKPEIEGAKYFKPQLSDLFLAIVGGSNE